MKAELDALAHGELWLRDAVGHDVGATLTKPEALAVTAKIKGYAGVAWILLLEAHNRQAHKAMGYKSWADYVAAEFDMSKSRSYQLISQAKVIIELTEEVSTMVDISEREARDLAPLMVEAKAAAVDAVEALPADAPPKDKTDAVRDALDRLRVTAVEAKRPKAPPKVESGEAATREGAVHGEARDESSSDSLTPKTAAHDHEHLRSAVARWVAAGVPEHDIDAMTTAELAKYRAIVLAVFDHANATIDYIDKSHLKVVPS